jgi:uronate dehydrogenase
MTVWGVSDNARSYWDKTGAEKLGYRPQQNSEVFAPEILARPNPLGAIAQQYQGGAFVTLDYTPPDARPGAS